MCVILVAEKSRIEQSEHDAASNIHQDGVGIIWRDKKGRGWQYYRGTTPHAYETVRNMLNTARLPYVVHYRMVSSGEDVPELAHPFPITKEPAPLKGFTDSALAHNGHWSRGDQIAEYMKDVDGDEWSDTRVCVAMLANRKSKEWREVITKDGPAGKYASGKVALMDVDGRIRLYGSFSRDEGIARSNNWHRGMSLGAYSPHTKNESYETFGDWWKTNEERETMADSWDDDYHQHAAETQALTVQPMNDGTIRRATRREKKKARKDKRRFWHAGTNKMKNYTPSN